VFGDVCQRFLNDTENRCSDIFGKLVNFNIGTMKFTNNSKPRTPLR